MDTQEILNSEYEVSNDIPSKRVAKHEIINFKRKRITDIRDEDDLRQNVIILDPDTALKPEMLTIELREDEDEEVSNVDEVTTILTVDDDSEYYEHNDEIVAEELVDGQHPLNDLELEEGEVRNENFDYFKLQYLKRYSSEYECPVCHKTFTQKGNLMRHYDTHTGAKKFACNLCGHKFTQKSNLQKHIATHNGDKKFVCGICHKSFVQKANLIRHLRIHTGEKPFQCDLCGHKFTQKGNLNKHLLLHSSDSETTCDYCDCSFASYAAKMRHEDTVHNENSDSGASREVNTRQDFQCEECPAVFRTHRALSKHKKFHD